MIELCLIGAILRLTPLLMSLLFPKPAKRSQKARKRLNRKRTFKVHSNPLKTYRRRPGEEVYARQCQLQHLINPTEAESAMADALRGLGVDFEREHILWPASFILIDFWLPQHGLAIELDGLQHRDARPYDMQRDKWVYQAHRMRVVRLWNSEVLASGLTDRLRKLLAMS